MKEATLLRLPAAFVLRKGEPILLKVLIADGAVEIHSVEKRFLGDDCDIEMKSEAKTLAAEIDVEVQDDGRGMPTGKRTTESGVGRSGMRERTTKFSGRLEIESSGNGTIVLARLPLPTCGAAANANVGS